MLNHSTIFQGYTGAETHSLHLTVSFCRNTAFIDLLEKLLPVTLSSLANNLRGLRQSLPVQYLDMEGVLRKNYKLSDQFALRYIFYYFLFYSKYIKNIL